MNNYQLMNYIIEIIPEEAIVPEVVIAPIVPEIPIEPDVLENPIEPDIDNIDNDIS